jgi:methionine aminopeptidase
VLKVDFGVHVKGTIVDSAFTMNFEPTWDRLLEAVKDATNTGVRVCPCPLARVITRLTNRLPD